MPAIPHVFRRNATYYWRRRLCPCADSINRILSFSLHTRDGRLARERSAFLTATSERLLAARRSGLLTHDEITAIMRDEADQYSSRLRENVIKARFEGFDAPFDGETCDRLMAEVYAMLARKGWHGNWTAEELGKLTEAGFTPKMKFEMAKMLVALRRDMTPEGREAYLEPMLIKHAPRYDYERVDFGQAENAYFRARAAVLKQKGRWHIDETEDEDLIFGDDGCVRDGPVAIVDEEFEALYARVNEDGSEPSQPVPEVLSPAPMERETTPPAPAMPPQLLTAEQLISEDERMTIAQVYNVLRSNQTRKTKKEKGWNPKTARQATTILTFLEKYLREFHEIQFVEDIKQRHLHEFNEVLLAINPQHGKAAVDSTLSAKAYVDKYLTRYTGEDCLAPATLNRHLTFISQFFRKAKLMGRTLQELDVTGFRRPKERRERDEREIPEMETVQSFFKLPVFTGCKGWDHRAKGGIRALHHEGDLVFHRAAFFVPILAYYTGARREELCGLAPDDLAVIGDHHVIFIRPNSIRKLKNKQSRRSLVLHSEIIRLGFATYVEQIRALNYVHVFPELISPTMSGSLGDRLYDELEVSFKASKFSTHHLRHVFNNSLKQKEVSEEIRADLLGHGGSSEASERYVNPAKVALQASKVAMLDVITDHLPAHEPMLLPWIVKKQSAPWTKLKPVPRPDRLKRKSAEPARSNAVTA